MLIAILVIETLKLIALCLLVFNLWPKKAKTGGWIAPIVGEPVFDESDNVIPMTEKYENDFINEQEPTN